ncbi:conjugal transfer protein TraN [Thiomonas sp.]
MRTLFRKFPSWSLLLGLLLLGVSSPAWALFGCTQNYDNCVSAGCKNINGATVCTQGSNGGAGALYVNASCWQYNEQYTCYTGQQTNSCSAAQLSGCYLSSTTCTQTLADGNCVQWAANYICPGGSTTTCQATGPLPAPGSCQSAQRTCNQTDNGTCINQTNVQVCPASTTVPQCNTQGNCTLNAATCTSSQDGVCNLEQQTYTCGLSKQVCTQTETSNNCNTAMTYGLGANQTQKTSNSFQEAATYMGILNAISKDMTPGKLTIFPGKPAWCTDPILNGFITNNCCNTNITGKGGNILDKCSTAEQQLSSARRAHRAVYLGQWCNQRFIICISQKQGYCVFDSVLAKIIQQQGREQLAQLAASGYAGAQSGTMNFSYFSQNGGWGPRTTVNGNTVAVWQWPTYCEAVNGQVDIAAEQAAEQNGGIVCPSMPAVWFATCNSGQACGALPDDPRSGANGPGGWALQNVAPTDDTSYSLSKFTVATGACNLTTGACNYSLSAWPSASGGNANLQMSLGWPLYAPGNSTINPGQINQLGNYEFQTVTLAGSPTATFPATVPLNYSLNAGVTWQQVQLPTNLPIGQVSIGSNISVYGQCNQGSFQCHYTVIAPVSVSTMPWGSPQSPQCEGFTTAQLSVLDFNKMNLSEYIATLTPASLNQSQMASNATADAQSFYHTFTSGGSAPVAKPSTRQAAVICDNFNGVQCQDESASGMGPFPVELNAATVWPPSSPNHGAVSSVSVDWGDGSSGTASQANGMFVANHQYPAVNTDTTYTATVTFNTTNDGVQTVQIQVVDAASTPPPGSATNTGGGNTNSPVSTYTPSSMPNGNSALGGPGVPAGAP